VRPVYLLDAIYCQSVMSSDNGRSQYVPPSDKSFPALSTGETAGTSKNPASLEPDDGCGASSVSAGYRFPEEKRFAFRQQHAAEVEQERRHKEEQRRWSDAREMRRVRARLRAISDGEMPAVGIGTQLCMWFIMAAACAAFYFWVGEPYRWIAIAFTLLCGAMDMRFMNLEERLDAQQALAKMPPPDEDELTVTLGPPTRRERTEWVFGILLRAALIGGLIWLGAACLHISL
jgi:hypothetical protein